MKARLLRRGIPEDAAATVIADLTRAGLLSDAAFADETARLETSRKPASDEFLRQKIESKGVHERTAAKAAASAVAGVSELARAKELAIRSVRPSTDPVAARRRLLGVLLRRGFDPETAAAAADHALGELPEPDGIEFSCESDQDHPESIHDDL